MVLLVVGVYWPARHGGFIWDDPLWLWENPVIRQGAPWWRYFMAHYAETPDYYPVTSTFFWLQWHLFGPEPSGYRVVQVLLHAAGSLLVWRVLVRAGMHEMASFVAAAIFAVHPLNVTTVAWITEQKNTLSLVFYAGSVWIFLRAAARHEEIRTKSQAPNSNLSDRPSLFWGFGLRACSRWYAASYLLFLLGLLSKASGVLIPLALLLILWRREGKINGRSLWRVAPLLAMAVVVSVLTILFQSEGAIRGEVVRPEGFGARLAASGWAFWFYTFKTVWPTDLMMVYPRWNVDGRRPAAYLPTLLAVMLVLAFWHHRRTWGGAALTALGWYLLMLLPILGFFEMYFHIYALVADHWQYMAMPGLAALAVLGTATWLRGLPGLQAAAAIALIAVLSVLTWRRAHLFHDEQTLWADTLRRNPTCWVAHNNLGTLHANRGDAAVAMRHFREAAQLRPDYAAAYDNMGRLLAQHGRLEAAAAQFTTALSYDRYHTKAHKNLGRTLAQLGRANEALDHLRLATRLNPQDTEAPFLLGLVLSQEGRFEEAAKAYRAALDLWPRNQEARYNLGMTLAQLGQHDEAARQFERALALKPDDAGARWRLAESLAALGRTDQATRQLHLALQAATLAGNESMMEKIKQALSAMENEAPE